MSTKKQSITKDQYKEMVEQISPNSPILLNCLKAFLVGGTICVIGQIIHNFFENMGISYDQSSAFTVITLVFIGSILTAFNLYSKLGRFAGGGSIVPITGFANAVAAAAVEFKKEGAIAGLGTKIFSIAGPVICYGIFSSFIVGIIYYVSKLV